MVVRLKLLGACLAALASGGILQADLYDRLGVDREAEESKIRSAFKKKALSYHPDKNPDDPDAHTKMIEINEALDVLTNPELRKAYNVKGMKGVEEARKTHGNGQQRGANGDEGVQFYENFALYDDDPQVEVLDYHSWEASHSSTETYFVNFYSPSCSHCVQSADAWRRIGDRFHGMMHVAAVNCDENYPVCRAAGVRSLPAIKLWPKGGPRNAKQPMDYTPDVQGAEGYDYEKLEAFALNYFPNDVQTLLPQDFPSGAMLPGNADTSKDWVIGFCNNDCEELNMRAKEVAAMFSGLIPVGTIDCGALSDLCRTLNKDPYRSGPFFTVYSGNQQVDYNVDQGAKAISFAALSRLDALPVLPLDEFERVSANAVHHEHVSKIKASPKEYLIMFYNPNTCNHQTELGPGTAPCWKAGVALRHVIKAINMDWEYKDLTATTFNCDSGARRDGRVKVLCEEMAKNDDGSPTMVLLKDGGLNAEHFFNHIERPNEIIAFVQENFKSTVHELLQEDFDLHVVKEQQTWFIDFNAPWCHHCRDVWPEWNLASSHYDLPKDVEIHFGKINCEEHHEMCVAHHIRSYPTFLLFHEGVRHQFDFASRTAEEFVRFIKETLEPVEHEFTPEDYKVHIYDPARKGQMATEDDGERWMIDFFAPWCIHCTIMSPKYREAATVLRGVMKFGKVNCELDSGFCMQLGIRAYPTIWRFDTNKPRDVPTAKYPGLPDPKLILNFAMEGVPDFVEELDIKNFDKRVKTEEELVSWVVAFHTSKADDLEECERLLMKTKALASRFNEKQRKNSMAPDDPAAAKPHQVFFGKFDCRASGQAYTFCMKEKIKKQPMLVFYSGARNQQSILEKDDMLKVISDIDKHIHDDRRELNHPFREKHTFHYHDEL